jgi:hypothetical protein
VVGIDLAEPFISYARARAALVLPRFEVGDACAFPMAAAPSPGPQRNWS